MALAAADIEQIEEMIRARIPAMIAEASEHGRGASIPLFQVETRERLIRLEEESKLQREIMISRFEAMDRRFESLQVQMDKRFEAVDKRFEAMDQRFESLQVQMNKRFEAMDQRFESLQVQMDKRFEAMEKRFDAVEKRFTFMQWIMGIGFTMIVAAIALTRVIR